MEVRHVVGFRVHSSHIMILVVLIVHFYIESINELVRRHIDSTESLIGQLGALVDTISLIISCGTCHLTGSNLPHHADFPGVPRLVGEH